MIVKLSGVFPQQKGLMPGQGPKDQNKTQNNPQAQVELCFDF
jgi:hypothetical protein